MRYRFCTALLCLLTAGCAVSAGAVPGSFSYQGKLTNTSGQPVPDGYYSLVFKLYNSQPHTTPVWTSAKVKVATTGGVFTTELSPPTKVFEDNDIWLETEVNGTPLSPTIKLLVVPYAARAESAETADLSLTVPDGSITPGKLSSNIGAVRAPYLMGVRSGLPPGTVLNIYVDNLLDGGNPTILSASFTQQVVVIQNRSGYAPDDVLTHTAGKQTSSSLVLRRNVSGNKTWFGWAMDTWTGMAHGHNVELRLVGPQGDICRWTGMYGLLSQYTVRLADDGIPVEEITLEFDSNRALIREQLTAGTPTNPTGSGAQVGFTSGFAVGSYALVAINSTQYPDYVLAEDSWFGRNVLSYWVAPNSNVQIKELDVKLLDGFGLRQNPTANNYLYQWFANTYAGTLVKRRVSLSIVDVGPKGGTTPVVTYDGAWPHSYTLRLADDGLPVEEFDLIFDTVAQP